MPKARTCHLPNSTALFCIGVERLGQAEPLQRHGGGIVVAKLAELGGRRW
jgi:hypothetical protein